MFSSMNTESTLSLSAIVPINRYFQHKVNIEKIIRDSVSMDIELMLVLDRESDAAFEDLTALLKKLNGSGFVIASDSGNPGGARNAGLVRATGEWITFWDCDDEPVIPKIFKMVLSSTGSEAQVLVGSYQTRSQKDEIAITQILDGSNWEIELGLNPGIWRFVFRKDLIEKIRFPEARMGEDQIFIQRVFNVEPRVSVYQDVTYIYVVNVPNQLTGEKINLIDLEYMNKIALHEFNPGTKHSKISKTMIVRQLLTLSRSEKLSKIARMTYLLKTTVCLIRNPKISMKVIQMILEKLFK